MIGSARLEPLVALAIVAVAFTDPIKAAIAVGRLVGLVLIEARMHMGISGAT